MSNRYYAFTGVDTGGDAFIYVKRNGDTIERSQIEGIADALQYRLNGEDPLSLFVKAIARGEMSWESMVAEAKEVLREEEEG